MNRYVYLQIEDREICRDIVQDAFFTIWKNRKNISIDISFNPLCIYITSVFKLLIFLFNNLLII